MRTAVLRMPRLKPRTAPLPSHIWRARPICIVHLSNEDALRELKHAHQRGLRALAETCPRYLLVLSLEEQMPGKSWDEAKYCVHPAAASKTSPGLAMEGAWGRDAFRGLH